MTTVVVRAVAHPRARARVLASTSASASASATATRAAVKVRRANESDVAAVANILSGAALEMASPPPLSSLKSYARLACAAAPEDELALVAELPDDELPTTSAPDVVGVVGVVGVLFDRELKPHEMRLDPSTAYVTNLAVSPRCRRRGAGLSLLRAAEDAARDAGFETVACRVEETNVAARAMYDGLGYDAHEPARIGKFRRLMAALYAGAGAAHFYDAVIGSGTLLKMAGAPAFAAMSETQRAAVVLWCAAGPAALASERLGGKTAAVVGLAFYGAVEVGLAAMCAKYYGASGGDAATGAVCVQAVVFVCYQLLAPRQAAGMLTIARKL
ncbi:uncharacterized protein MICPUCDRAFT_65422 [Micromonas pusilla CCMP1545]|uniref:Predicted protein n=1 Tax=Micromonas pusilla (strain CCMP1545) TaxID=564608 RepID=C1MVN0_MICPC|nr:uncharacterized protein MICPUCDRAFT_65422 [Micromonas pusilla CCMP1545]EEH55733.1 predicted protein [Micromonas pusilla CCMP1545]|eukprot:XP_003059781.1 predicted protein [Micromonas pusilla CCMP1545]